MKIFNKSEWKKVKLGDICDILDSRRIPISEEKRIKGKYPYYGANGIQGYINDYIFDEELVLLAEDGGNFGSKTKPIAYKINGKTWVNNHAHVLKARNKIISTDFLLYSLMFYDVTKLITGTTRKKLTRTGMEKITLFIPNLDVQDKITNYLQKIEKFISLRKNQLNYLKELNKSLFTTMFGDIKSNDKNWEVKKIGEVVQTQYGTSKKATSVPTEFPILRMNNITYSGEMNYKDLKYIVLNNDEKEKFLLKKGELLFNRTNSKELVGKTGLFNLDIPMAFAGYLIRIKPSRLINSKFLLFFMNSKFMKKVLYNKAKNIVGMANINAKELEDFSIILPPIELQNKFAERVEKIEKLKFTIWKIILKVYETLKKKGVESN